MMSLLVLGASNGLPYSRWLWQQESGSYVRRNLSISDLLHCLLEPMEHWDMNSDQEMHIRGRKEVAPKVLGSRMLASRFGQFLKNHCFLGLLPFCELSFSECCSVSVWFQFSIYNILVVQYFLLKENCFTKEFNEEKTCSMLDMASYMALNL